MLVVCNESSKSVHRWTTASAAALLKTASSPEQLSFREPRDNLLRLCSEHGVETDGETDGWVSVKANARGEVSVSFFLSHQATFYLIVPLCVQIS